LGSYTYTIDGNTYPPTLAAYSASVNYIATADVYYASREYIALENNGPATSVVTPGTNVAVWKIIPFRFFYYQTPLATLVTFDAVDSESLGLPKVYAPPGVSIVSYEWDFGNGETGYGSTASTTYTYNQGPPDLQVVLTIIDSLGRQYSTAHYLALESGIESIGYSGYTIGPPTT
jgi:hypothetical protein